MSAEQLISYNPQTGEELGRVSSWNKNQIQQAFSQSQQAFNDWRETSWKERNRLIKSLRRLVLEQSEDLAQLISSEQGKPEVESLATEIIPVLDTLKYLEKKGQKELRPQKVKYSQMLLSHKQGTIYHEPYGVISVISPWNFPFSIPVISAVEAIYAGNSVVLKPSPFTILVAQKIQDLFHQAGFPINVMQTVFCKDQLAPLLIDNDYTRKVMFTGSVATGKKIMATAAERLLPVVLELGGKDPTIVTSHANLPRAAAGIIWGAFMNTGQACASVERVYVERAVHDKLRQLLLQEAEKASISSMIHEQQRAVVEEHLQQAKKEGAEVIWGGKLHSDEHHRNYIEPTILDNCHSKMTVMQQETFGPLCCIMEVESFQEALTLANTSEYGLNASLWSDNKKEQQRFWQQAESGTATINDCIYPFGEPSIPWGGRKHSGIGRTHSRFGLMEMVQPKYVGIDTSKKRNLWWYPYNEEYRQALLQATQGLYAQNYFTKTYYTLKMLTSARIRSCLNLKGVVKGFWNWF